MLSLFPAVPVFAVIAGDEPMSLLQDIGYQTVGMGIVVGALAILAIFLTVVGHFFAAHAARMAQTKATLAAESAASSPSHNSSSPTFPGEHGTDAESIPADIRAAIFAAVYVTMGSNTRVLDIHPSHPEFAAWSMEGRRQIFLSHRVR